MVRYNLQCELRREDEEGIQECQGWLLGILSQDVVEDGTVNQEGKREGAIWVEEMSLVWDILNLKCNLKQK